MGSQSIEYAKPWYTPFRFMLVILVLCFIESLLVGLYKVKVYAISTSAFLTTFIWPSVLLIEVIFYWVVRRRIKERKFVWAHLIFSLFSFALLPILYVAASFIAFQIGQSDLVLKFMYHIQYYSLRAGAIIGHIFFIVVIVQCFSGNNPQLPPDDNDLLSEMAG